MSINLSNRPFCSSLSSVLRVEEDSISKSSLSNPTSATRESILLSTSSTKLLVSLDDESKQDVRKILKIKIVNVFLIKFRFNILRPPLCQFKSYKVKIILLPIGKSTKKLSIYN